jgi:hypothetical protein
MIRFEFCETSTSRPAAAEAKALRPAIAMAEASDVETPSAEPFSLESEASAEEQRTGGKTRLGRSKKFRGGN